MKKIFTACITIILMAACSPKNKTLSDTEFWIPKNFDPRTITLLVKPHILGEKQNQRMDKFLKKNYPFSYEIITDEDDGKHGDYKKYPYVVEWSIGHSQTGGADMIGHFFERSSGRHYNASKRANGYGQVGYMPFFNSITKKFN